MKKDNFDPLDYIERGFLDTRCSDVALNAEAEDLELALPSISDYLNGGSSNGHAKEDLLDDLPRFKKRKTAMSAPRPRLTKKRPPGAVIDPELEDTWRTLPKNIAFLYSFFDDRVASHYYTGEFKESRKEMILRILDPELSLEDTSRLLGVCPATIRRYTNRGWLSHHRTKGSQRRFRLSDIVRFVEHHGRLPLE